ncbi:MAG TPA: class I SAM-dependent methyltransferase [Symbiobacteriaceae bacterium]|nr:class I SAM-dependent methyltransferase [Symbiobacteriaceae bacterium]
MDRNRFSNIAHQNHVFRNPLNPGKLLRLAGMARLQPAERVLDIGAGTCELLICLTEAYAVQGTAVELDEGALALARQAAAVRIAPERLTLLHDDAAHAVSQFEADSFALGLCIGSTHALGGLASTLQELQRCVRPGGQILVGEGYWKQPPCADYLEALGAQESDLLTHAANVATGEQLGLIPLWASTTSDDEWDEYEWLYSSTVERYCQEHPEDPDRPAMLTRIRTWRSTYLQWGRQTLGFGLYLFQRV